MSVTKHLETKGHFSLICVCVCKVFVWTNYIIHTTQQEGSY